LNKWKNHCIKKKKNHNTKPRTSKPHGAGHLRDKSKEKRKKPQKKGSKEKRKRKQRQKAKGRKTRLNP